MLVGVLAIRFLVELALFAGAAVASAQLVSGSIGRVLLGVVGCVAIVVVWGAFLAPKRPTHWSLPARVVLEVLLFVLVGMGLWSAGFGWAAIALLGADVLVLAGLFVLGDEPGRHFDLSDTTR